ncbi:MAG TPA: glyceraldehyde 3-phosphate dehydrogenase NAD-binding domain-containing protein, partial [Thermoanaerobaculia bacterium]|nr:glyceraldehyde 3-phosphate dehydrogenase NAD-binding domain-containing protein [Thermoanaerobaculia bacterium]
MPTRIAINGLGRVGRALIRIARERPGLELAAVNDPAPPEVLARLIAHDSLHGRYPGEVAAEAAGRGPRESGAL